MNSNIHQTPETGALVSHLHILQHALGVDRHGHHSSRGGSHRNHFVTGEGSTDYTACLRLVDAGLMTRTRGNAITGGDDLFRVTRAGIDYVALNSPTPPPARKLTRSQRRYQAWLDADCGYSFAEWLGVPPRGRR